MCQRPAAEKNNMASGSRLFAVMFLQGIGLTLAAAQPETLIPAEAKLEKVAAGAGADWCACGNPLAAVMSGHYPIFSPARGARKTRPRCRRTSVPGCRSDGAS